MNPVGDLVLGRECAAVRQKHVRRNARTRRSNDERHYDFTAICAWNASYASLGNARMLQEEFLDLRRRDIDSGLLDQFRVAAEKYEIPVAVQVSDIAGPVEPVLSEGVSRKSGAGACIAWHDIAPDLHQSRGSGG